MNELQYRFHQLQETDVDLLNLLLETASEIHGRKVDSIEWLKWKYFGSPFGNAISIIALTSDNKIAGEVTFGCYEFILNLKIIPCIISYQTMVHPNHQKKGLFLQLTDKVLAIAKTKQIDLVFNFPNQASFKPFVKMNFTPINHIKNWVNFSNFLNIILNIKSLKSPFFADSINKVSDVQLKIFEELKDSITPLKLNDILVPNRTYSFIKWRYFTYPLYNYQILKNNMGWAIIRTGKRGKLIEVQVMEIFPHNDNQSKLFIKLLKKSIKTVYNPNIILLNLSENHPSTVFIKNNFFFSLPHSINFFAKSLNPNYNHLINKDSWIITPTEFHRY
ncbi:MAG: GNAT family N-acetyltransferase [Flavobacteriales bacterium]|nr:GNAT family N-acetyltransferase [Flavobacteriales bacterium]